MNLTLQTLANYLEDFLSSSQFQDYCPNGLQVEGKESISKIALAVSASLATIQEAKLLGADALIVHHGLFWNKESQVITASKRKKLKLLLENDISLLAYHLPLDAHPSIGNNWKAAIDLGFQDLESFHQIGVKGTFQEIEIGAFLSLLENYYNHPCTHALGGKKRIKNAAIISGGAYKELIVAASKQIDCFITGSFDEPAWNMAFEENIHFLALGHTATEKIGPKALGSHLQNRFHVETYFIDTDNPF